MVICLPSLDHPQAFCFSRVEGRVEDLPNIEIQVNYLEEEAREEIGRRKASQGLAFFP